MADSFVQYVASQEFTRLLACNILDESLAQKEKYETLKAERIKGLEKLLLNSNSLNTKYDIYKQLFEEYKTNQYDSAVIYANRCLQTANQLKDVNAIAQAKCAVAFCQISAGIIMEALPQLKSINSQDHVFITHYLRSSVNSNLWMPFLFALARIRTYASCSPLFIVVVT